MHALDTDTGCIHWLFQANGPVRSTIVMVPDGERRMLVFSDLTGWVYSLDASNGSVICAYNLAATRLGNIAATLLGLPDSHHPLQGLRRGAGAG